MLLPGFDPVDLDTPRGTIRAAVGGSGPPLLLLHGFPQTHLMWHSTAPELAEHFTVVAADLPGYGDSFLPPISEDHSAHGKRALAADLVAAMAALGHERFRLAGHDRGGRVAYRLALDHPDAVERLAVLDIVPTGEIWARADAIFALGYWHWPFLAQPAPLPERLMLASPDVFWIAAQRMGMKPGDERFPAETIGAYRVALMHPDRVSAMCEDYRAGATVDREHDDADRGTRTIGCPVRVLWGADGALPLFYDDPLEVWRTLAPDATGRGIDGAGHFLAEDQPQAVLDELRSFFS